MTSTIRAAFLSTILSLGAAVSAQAAELELDGSAWAWDQAAGSFPQGPGIEATTAGLRFLDGSVEVFLGCNTAFGEFAVTAGGEIAIRLQGKTKMLCADMLYEDMFYTLLEQAVRVGRDGLQLVFFNATGAELLRLDAR